ncbi:MAG: Ni/Fe hydrogenase subunit alpha [Gammaproteobacteria bacterium]|jgi:coenzyme F420-reducing hydrogenase alpha subunit|nr:Ni/Fe hydrogenase subunit alpha [Gammaproteobacteria bacterium]
MTQKKDVKIHVPVLARVEGEGALELDIENSQVASVKLRIFEPPRFFEKFLEGRDYNEVIDTVARICGICPVAYQMSAVHAIEHIFDIPVHPTVRALRRVMYCGEWLESHGLHIHLLAAPDFLGFANAIELGAAYPEEVKRGLRLQHVGNKLIKLFGGRSVHPVGVRVGGFYRLPTRSECDAMVSELKAAVEECAQLVLWTASLPLPEDEQEFTSVALQHPEEYAMNEGNIVSSLGLSVPADQYQNHFEEIQVPHSTAFHSHLHGKPYLVGPLARVNLNWDSLHEPVQQLLQKTAIDFPSKNVFHSVIARAAEMYYALLEAIAILESIDLELSPVNVTPKSGVGYACTEAPRGILWHRYEMDQHGHVIKATIVPPTSQNQARIEDDLRNALNKFDLTKSDEDIRLHAETIIRNYDPCISCSTHFLNLTVNRKCGES